MSNTIKIQSHKGPYDAEFIELKNLNNYFPKNQRLHFIVDDKLLTFYPELNLLTPQMTLLAHETTKNLSEMTTIIEKLAKQGIKRGDTLVAIGGGIIQDITCFISSTMFRGLNWIFVPTTLLAQADSCIGSKSSINVGSLKNIVGTFNPPQKILIATEFLKTLNKSDILSGVGEMIKVHMIDGPTSFLRLEQDYNKILSAPEVARAFIQGSLLIKKKLIEEDEFDHGIRNILNYGHSFGHAIESATKFAIPHGVAVTLGMDMANFVAWKTGHWMEKDFKSHHNLLKLNCGDFYFSNVPMDLFLGALSNDKKNSAAHLNLILPNSKSQIEKVSIINNAEFKEICRQFFDEGRKL